MLPRLPRSLFPLACLAALMAPATVHAAPIPTVPTTITLDFNSLPEGASASQLQAYLDSIFPGISIAGARVDASYNADGHVVGPTLGTSDGGIPHPGLDSFLATNGTLQNSNGKDVIRITFPFAVKSASFDFEIFPNMDAEGLTDPTDPRWPDFTFRADGNIIFRRLGELPPGSPDPQLLAQSGLITFAGGVSTLEFIDWPPTIGIDNLQVNGGQEIQAVVPEPASLLVFAILAAGVAACLAPRRYAVKAHAG